MSDDEIRAVLHRAADAAGDDLHPPSPATFRARRGRRRQMFAGVAASVAIVGAVVGLNAGISDRQSTPTRTASPPAVDTGPIDAGKVTAAQLARFHWTALPPAPIASRTRSAAVWTGSQMIVWGGRARGRAFADGATYTPSTRTWRTLPSSPLTARSDAYAIWTGTRLIIWGGDGPNAARTGAVYDPASGTWTTMPAAPAAHGYVQDFVWNGSAAVRLTTNKSFAATAVGVTAYDPTSNSWHQLQPLRFGAVNNYTGATGAMVRGRFVVWVSSTGAYTYRPATRRWVIVPYAPSTAGCIYDVLPTPKEIVYPADFDSTSCGGDAVQNFGPRGTALDLATGQAREIAYSPTSNGNATVTWTGRALLNADAGEVTDTYPSSKIHLPNGASAAWDPTTNHWLHVARAPAVDPDAAWVWTGTQLIGWGDFQPNQPDGRHIAALTLAGG